MATIRKRGNSWQVQIRRQGFSPLAQSFSTHADAVAWARDKERSIDRSEILPNHRSLKAVRLHDLLDRYEREVTSKKRGADQEIHKLRILKAHDVAKAGLDKISGRMIASYRDDRLKLVSSGTVRRETAHSGCGVTSRCEATNWSNDRVKLESGLDGRVRSGSFLNCSPRFTAHLSPSPGPKSENCPKMPSHRHVRSSDGKVFLYVDY